MPTTESCVAVTQERLDELRRIAEAATPGERVVEPCPNPKYDALVIVPDWGDDGPELAVFLNRNDAQYFSDVDPHTVLALLGEIQRLREVLNTNA